MTRPQDHYPRASARDVREALRHDYSAGQVAIALGEADMSGRMECRRFILTSNDDGSYDLRLYAS